MEIQTPLQLPKKVLIAIEELKKQFEANIEYIEQIERSECIETNLGYITHDFDTNPHTRNLDVSKWIDTIKEFMKTNEKEECEYSYIGNCDSTKPTYSDSEFNDNFGHSFTGFVCSKHKQELEESTKEQAEKAEYEFSHNV